ncbi:S1 family peptidase [Actinoalloteichus sp. GBA129-24]|uniref:S1 family peptidase n=1 Tax=Actinoalloteichus sp. GBA129-24 TaxID=1612551 RepID=UPI000950A230|nr:serine protease [Actinoalloteichus sp. GBA129-24]APU22578.1 Trypsin [Actinoalloteichus sp. GBA129-24]
MTVVGERVAAIWTRRSDGRWRLAGSGYAVGGGLVLTAAHVVGDRPVRVRLLDDSGGLGRTRSGSTVWRRLDEGCDAAVVRLAEPPAAAPVRWGRLTGRAPGVRCTAVGFPLFNDEAGQPAPEQLDGRINPITLGTRGRQVVDVESWPGGAAEERSPWSGMSGASVVAGGRVIGVIRFDEREFDGRRLSATPITTLLADEEFTALLRESLLDDTAESVELAELLRPLRRPSARSSPVALLRPEFASVPFYGRDAELADLADWCADPDAQRVALIVGGGGQGKTRLAYELLHRQREQGWVCGVLTTAVPAARTPFAALRDTAHPVLLVLDYAETRVEYVHEFVRALTDTVDLRPVRLLLLARSAGDWWLHLRRREDFLSDALPARPMFTLAQMEPTVEGRRRAFDEAVQALAARLSDRPDLPHHSVDSAAAEWTPDLAGDAYGRVLTIHIAALVALLRDGRTVPATTDRGPGPVIRPAAYPGGRADPARGESERDDTTTSAAGRAAQKRVTAVSTTGTASSGPAATAAETAPGPGRSDPLASGSGRAHDIGTAGGRRTARSAATTTGGRADEASLVLAGDSRAADPAQRLIDHERRYWDRMAVQRGIGYASLRERAVAALLLHRPADAETAMTLVGRAMMNVPDAGDRREIAQWARALYPPEDASDGYLGGFHPDLLMEHFLGELLASENDLLPAIIPGIDGASAVRLLTQIARAAEHPEFFPWLGRRIGDLIRSFPHELAVAAVAVAPSARYPRPIAEALSAVLREEADHGLIAALHQAMPERSLALAEPAVEATRRMIDALDADPAAANATAPAGGTSGANTIAAQAVLAESLRKLVVQLVNTDRASEALDAAGRAESVYGSLAALDPARFAVDLVEAGAVTAARCAEVGLTSAAMLAIQRALAVFNGLGEQGPRHRPVSARLLACYARILQDTPDDGLSTFMSNRAVALYEGLYRENPRDHREPLAECLTDRADHLCEVGSPDDAVRDLDTAMALYEVLSDEWPDRYDAVIVGVIHRKAVALLLADRPAEAEEHITRVVAFLRPAEQDESAGSGRLVSALLTHSAAALRQGDLLTALNTAEEAGKLADALGEDDILAHLPSASEARRHLADCYGASGSFDVAISHAAAAVESFQMMSEREPDRYEPALAVAMNTMVRWLIAGGQGPAGLTSAEEALALSTRLARRSPRRHRDELADALSLLTRCRSAAGLSAEAAETAEEAVACWEQLVSDRGLGRHREELAVALVELARLRRAAGTVETALPLFKRAFLLRSDLAAEHPERGRSAVANLAVEWAAVLRSVGRPEAASAMAAHAWRLATADGIEQAHTALRRELPRLYSAAPDALAEAWRSESGGELPDWVRGE